MLTCIPFFEAFSSPGIPLLLCILKNILRSLLALSISMVLFRILNPVPVLATPFFFFLSIAPASPHPLSVTSILSIASYTQILTSSEGVSPVSSMPTNACFRAFSTGIWIIIDGSISFISTSLAIWNRGFGRNGLVSWRREE